MSRRPPLLSPGEPAPWFIGQSLTNSHYHFNTVAGRHVVLYFAGSLRHAPAAGMLAALMSARALFDDKRCSLFVVTGDASDVAEHRAADSIPGIRVLKDYDGSLCAQFGLAAEGAGPKPPALVLLDPALRVMAWFGLGPDTPHPVPALLATIGNLPAPLSGPALPQAPVMVLPRIFEPDFCRALIAHYERSGGEDSGYMRKDPDGIRGVIDYGVKRRMDCIVEDETLRRAIGARIARRLQPEILRVFRFAATRMERYLVACYDSATGGYFRPHRDNDGSGHRQFAVTINLNAEDYEGGDLRFPEYGQQTYRAPTGGACVFSCGLMHEATPVTQGRRFAFLPFLYDDASAQRREENNAKYVDPKHHYHQGKADGE